MGSGASSKKSPAAQQVVIAPAEKQASATSSQAKNVPPPTAPPPDLPKQQLPRAKSWKERDPPPQAVQEEIIAMLRITHAPQLRHLPLGLWPELAKSAIVEEIPVGAVKKGNEVWGEGTCLVLSGNASIILEFDNVDVEVARLHEGDAYGWHPGEDDMFHEDAEAQKDECLWESSKARVVVDSERPLRIVHVTKDFLQEVHATTKAAAQIEQMRETGDKTAHRAQAAAAEQLKHLEPEVHSRLASLWLMSSAPKIGICRGSGLVRAHFLAALWLPLYDLFERLNEEIHWRHKSGYRVQDRFPLLGYQINELKDHVMQLTSIWYGEEYGGNLSAFFRWFMESMELCGVTAYKWEIIPTVRSPDGWALLIDQAPRAAALKAKAAAGASVEKGASQKQGRSAIDNTVLRNVFTQREAKELLVGRVISKMLTMFIRCRQQIILRKLSKRFQLDLYKHASASGMGHGHREVQFVLSALTDKDTQKMGIDKNGLAFRALRDQGGLLQTTGSLCNNDLASIQSEITRLLIQGTDDTGDAAPKADSACEFERFVAHCRDKPGEYYEGERWKHNNVKIAGLWCGKVVVVKRSGMEKFTNAKFFPISWRRTQPLCAVTPAGTITIREADIPESSSVRVNECPYAALHGMSLSGAGLSTDETPGKKRKEKGKRYGMLMELQWIKDPNAAIENWGLTDIEKVVQETYSMNPHGLKEHLLPGEGFVYVGQNPKVGSSIKATQHTQLCAASAVDYPFFSVSTKPIKSAKLKAEVDLVDVGPFAFDADKRGTLLKVVTDTPTNPDIFAVLVQLRLMILEKFGGSEAVDFLCGCASNEQGSFITLFVPIAQLSKVDGVWTNPLTGETQKDADLDEPRIDYGKGVGHYLQERPELREQCWKSGGEDIIRRVYAFNRVPGCREAIQEFIKDKV